MLLWISRSIIGLQIAWLFESGENWNCHDIISEGMTIVLLLVMITGKKWTMHVAMQQINMRWSLVLLRVITQEIWVILIMPETWDKCWRNIHMVSI